MDSEPVYVLDANIFIEAYKRYYAFDIVPAFWRSIKQQAEAGRIKSIDRVFQEISAFPGKDDLKMWATSEFVNYFASTEMEEVFQSFREVMNWSVAQSQFTEAARAEFATIADSWLIAYAKAYNYVIVTHELFSAESKRRIPIPNVCRHFAIPCINTFDLLRRLKVRID